MDQYTECPFGWDARRIAKVIQLDVMGFCGSGGDGSVWMLETGQVMKLSISDEEAALSIYLMDGNGQDLALPRVDDVLWHPSEGGDSTGCWVIIREDVTDLWSDDDPRGLAWNGLHFIEAERCWTNAGAAGPPCLLGMPPDEVELMLSAWDCHGQEMREMHAAVEAVHKLTGVAVQDWWFHNMGRTAEGRLVIRDFGVCRMPISMLGLANIEEVENVAYELSASSVFDYA